MKQYIFPVSLVVALLIVGGVYLAGRTATQPVPVTESALTEVSQAPVSTSTDAVDTHVTPVSPAASSPAPTPTPAPAPTTPQPGVYSSAVVAQHASSASCWTSINGKVYDVTGWIHQHPGGAAAILSMCGTDGSAAFNGQHGGQRRPASELASFVIGTLQ